MQNLIDLSWEYFARKSSTVTEALEVIEWFVIAVHGSDSATILHSYKLCGVSSTLPSITHTTLLVDGLSKSYFRTSRTLALQAKYNIVEST